MTRRRVRRQLTVAQGDLRVRVRFLVINRKHADDDGFPIVLAGFSVVGFPGGAAKVRK
jgi:hypothetical protein